MYDDIVKLAPENIHTPHWLRTATADGLHQYVLTGVLAPHLPGIGNEWQQRTLRATIPLGGLAEGQRFTASQWAPAVAAAALNSDGETTRPGWAVDGFTLVDPNVPADRVVLDVRTAVRDANCKLLRMTYQITLVGTIT